MVLVLAAATTRSKSTGHTTAYLLSVTIRGALLSYLPARRALTSSHAGTQDTLTNMMNVSGTILKGLMQEVPRASGDPLIFHRQRVGAEATALTPAFALPYNHDQGVQPVLDLPSRLMRASDLILQLCLRRLAQQKKMYKANALLTE